MNPLLPLQVSGLTYAVEHKPLLQSVDLHISSDGICMIIGHNGAGKSLLLRLLHGLLTPTDGTISWAGTDASLTNTRQQQAMVFQKPLMLKRSVADNIRYVLKLRDKPPDELQRVLQSSGLQNKSNQSAGSLSGGEQQRLAIARALATRPSVLFLDEPTANLDPQATQQIEAQIINAKQQNIKIIMVTHDIAQARRLSNEIVFMHTGQLIEYTETEQFFQNPQTNIADEYLSAYTH